MQKRIESVASWLRERMPFIPQVAIVLGSGLGRLGDDIEVAAEFPYSTIPGFPVSTVEGHAGSLVVGRLAGKEVLAMKGRFHYYEGYDMKTVTLPIRVFHALGIRTLFVSNAAGGTNQSYRVGDLMLIADHINMMPEHPLNGPNYPTGPRFPDMSNAYDRDLRALARQMAKKLGITIQEGVYLASQGPTFETTAEYKMFRLLGADAVGMSTVPEVIVANHCGMRVLGFSVITNIGQKAEPCSHEEVQEAANAAQPRMSAIFTEVLKAL